MKDTSLRCKACSKPIASKEDLAIHTMELYWHQPLTYYHKKCYTKIKNLPGRVISLHAVNDSDVIPYNYFVIIFTCVVLIPAIILFLIWLISIKPLLGILVGVVAIFFMWLAAKEIYRDLTDFAKVKKLK